MATLTWNLDGWLHTDLAYLHIVIYPGTNEVQRRAAVLIGYRLLTAGNRCYAVLYCELAVMVFVSQTVRYGQV